MQRFTKRATNYLIKFLGRAQATYNIIILHSYFSVMTNDEVIVIDKIPDDKYYEIAKAAVRYALISIGFTYNRMDQTSIVPRIKNIIKGKIAEGLFFYYCDANGIKVDASVCQTPFWLPDLRDFLWLGGEWDIKNNFFYCTDQNFSSFNFTMLPALIPNKTYRDQWSKRHENLIYDSKFCAYLFTFIRLLPDQKEFFTLNLSNDQIDFLSNIEDKSKYAATKEMPFIETWFFKEMMKKGPTNYFYLHYFPEMVITGCANTRYFHIFKNTSASDPNENYKYFDPSLCWYTSKKDVLKFIDGALLTKIQNMTCPMKFLPSFKSVVKNAYSK